MENYVKFSCASFLFASLLEVSGILQILKTDRPTDRSDERPTHRPTSLNMTSLTHGRNIRITRDGRWQHSKMLLTLSSPGGGPIPGNLSTLRESRKCLSMTKDSNSMDSIAFSRWAMRSSIYLPYIHHTYTIIYFAVSYAVFCTQSFLLRLNSF